MPFKISRILHAGYIFEYDQTRVLFDPIFENPFSRNCYAFPDVEFDLKSLQEQNFDAVFISHEHDDHFSLESLNFIRRETPIYLFSPHKDLFMFLKHMKFQRVYPIQLERPIQIGRIRVTALEALEDIDSIYHIQAGEFNLLNVVDSWIPEQTLHQLKKIKWNLILWPFQTLRELDVIAPSLAEPVTAETTQLLPEWVEQLQALKPKALIPSSCQFRFEDWSWYNKSFFPISYRQFEKQIHESLPNTQVCRLNPGETLLNDLQGFEKGANLSWVTPRGPQQVDYDFDPHIKPQSMAEIARKFPGLTGTQKNEIESFCKNILPDLSESWKLIVYDHFGHTETYDYPVANSNSVWTTEISAFKLYAALFEGESLTSIYIRITPATQADPLEDPLLKALYGAKVGSYQKAQLRKIKPPL